MFKYKKISERISLRFLKLTIPVSLSFLLFSFLASCPGDKKDNTELMALLLASYINQDSGRQSVTITEDTTTFSENGGTGSYTIVLDAPPNGDVVIDVESQDEGEVQVSKDEGNTSAAGVSLTFTIENWSTAQTVTLTGQDDTAADGDQTVNITNSINASSTTDTTGYASIDPEEVSVTVTSDDNAWSQEAYIKAPNTDAGDYFGFTSSLSEDTLAVGAFKEDSNQTTITNGSTASTDNSASGSGAVYVFIRSGSTWSQQAYIKAPNAEADDYFGYSVSLNGDTLAVGATREDSNQTTITNGSTVLTNDNVIDAGAVYVFTRSGSTWSQQAYIKPPNPDESDKFGHTASLYEDTLAVGSQEDSNQTTITNGSTASMDNSATLSGAIYVFTRSGSTWSQEAYIKAPNAEAEDYFGYSVSLNGDTLAVGAYQEDSSQNTITNGSTASLDNSAADAGAVYVFTRNGSTWSQQAYIKAPNANADDSFGSSVSLYDDTLAVSAHREDSGQTTITNGSTASTDNSASNSGAVYVFTRDGSTWSQEAYLKASNGETGDYFGRSISLNEDSLAVGAVLEDSNQTTITNDSTASTDNSTSNSGAVYVFTRDSGAWYQEAYIKAPNVDVDDNFGYYNISIDADTLAVGAVLEDSNQTTITNGSTASTDNSAEDAGAVYVFKRTGGH